MSSEETLGAQSTSLYDVEADATTLSNVSRTVTIEEPSANKTAHDEVDRADKAVGVRSNTQADGDEPTLPRLWAILYDSGELTFQATPVPDSSRGSALGIWDATDTGTTWGERPPWVIDGRAARVARRVTLAEDARLAPGTATAAEALAAGDAPSAPAPRSLAWWFLGLASLEEVDGLDRLDTSLATTAESAFEGCASLETLDLSAWDGTSLADGETTRMLAGCASLARLTTSGRLVLAGASLPTAEWEHEGTGEHLASEQLCELKGHDVAGIWHRVTAVSQAAGQQGEEAAGGADAADGTPSADPAPDDGPDAPGEPVVTLAHEEAGDVLYVTAGPADGRVGSAGMIVGSWEASDTGAARAPWSAAAGNVVAARVLDPVAPRSLAGWFAGCARLASFEGLGLVDTSSCVTMGAAFAGCSSLSALDLSSWDTSACRDLGSAFSGCTGLKSLDLFGWDTTGALTMTGMLRGCSNLERVTLGPAFAFGDGCELPAGAWGRGNERLGAPEVAARAGEGLAGTWERKAGGKGGDSDTRGAQALVSDAPEGGGAEVRVTVPTGTRWTVGTDGDIRGRMRVANQSDVAVRLTGVSLLVDGPLALVSRERFDRTENGTLWLQVAGPNDAACDLAGAGGWTPWDIPPGGALDLDVMGQVAGEADELLPSTLDLGSVVWTFDADTP